MPIDLNLARSHHQRGNLDEAARLYAAALAEDPNRHEALHLAGLIMLQRGHPQQAVALIARAIAVRPDLAEYHSALAEAYRLLGQFDRALQARHQAHRLEPENPQLLCNLGALLVDVGQLDPAIAALRQAIRLNPNLAEGHNNLGNALRLQGNPDAALEHFQISARLRPDSAAIQANLGLFLLGRGEPEKALPHCREAVRLAPGLVEAWINLANVLQSLGQLEEAEKCLREAIRLRPEAPAAHANLGGVLEQLGDPEGSLAEFRETLRLDPRHAGVLARLATQLRSKLPTADQANIEALLNNHRLPIGQRVPLLFGLAHVCDARSEYDRAARLSIEANALELAENERKGLKYDPERHSKFVDQLIESFTPEFFERVQGWGLPTERPVFIVGMPRAGTSLVEQILASHSRVFGAGELRLAGQAFKSLMELMPGQFGSLRERLVSLDRPSLEGLARHHVNGLEALNGSADRIVDKMPENTLHLGLIATMFRRAILIDCRRDPKDVALSCWMTSFGQVHWNCDPGHIAHRITESRRLMDHWKRVLPGSFHEIRYEDIVNDLEHSARRLVEWCGLDWEPNCLEFHKTRRTVRTASVQQVRQPIYRGSIGRWKPYERSLAPLFETLGS